MPNPVDAYMTLLGYFNSLRELGGSRRIVEDEIRARLVQYSRRRRLEPADNLFSDRTIAYEVLELTSRVSTADVAAAKRRLGLPFNDKDQRVDVALATNMISVGLDIMRLGLLVALGQPKTSAEYIQATSRVGRDPERPGLVVTLLKVHKPRDRSNYERFGSYHASFYRAVEATSVTPFFDAGPRLGRRLVSLAAKGRCDDAAARGREIASVAPLWSSERRGPRDHDGNKDPAEAQKQRDYVLQSCRSLLDDWVKIASQLQSTNTKLQYQMWETAGPQRLLYDFLDPELASLPDIRRRFRANRSMRDVEPSVDLFVRNLNDWGSKP